MRCVGQTIKLKIFSSIDFYPTDRTGHNPVTRLLRQWHNVVLVAWRMNNTPFRIVVTGSISIDKFVVPFYKPPDFGKPCAVFGGDVNQTSCFELAPLLDSIFEKKHKTPAITAKEIVDISFVQWLSNQ